MEGVSFHFSTRQRDGATERFFIIYYETLRRLPLSAAKRKKKDFFRLNFFGYPLAARGHHQQIEIDCLCLFFSPPFSPAAQSNLVTSHSEWEAAVANLRHEESETKAK